MPHYHPLSPSHQQYLLGVQAGQRGQGHPVPIHDQLVPCAVPRAVLSDLFPPPAAKVADPGERGRPGAESGAGLGLDRLQQWHGKWRGQRYRVISDSINNTITPPSTRPADSD